MTIVELIEKEVCITIPALQWSVIKKNFGFKITKKNLTQLKNIDAKKQSYTGFESNGCIIYRYFGVLRVRDNTGCCYINF